MFNKRLTDEEIEFKKQIKDMDFTWSEIFSMIIAFYKAIFPYILILSIVMIGLLVLATFLLGGF